MCILKRLPSGKFATNQLVLHLVCLTYNLLPVIGQATIGREDTPLRKVAQSIAHARQDRIRYGPGNRWDRVTGQLVSSLRKNIVLGSRCRQCLSQYCIIQSTRAANGIFHGDQ